MTLIASALDEYRLAADALELELTENIALQNDETIIGTVRDLAAMGVRVSFDDYGTGYASLSLLKRFPLASLKIDRNSSAALHENAEDAAVVNRSSTFAKNFALDVVAEGIETEEQERVLREPGLSVWPRLFVCETDAGGRLACRPCQGRTRRGRRPPRDRLRRLDCDPLR